MPVAIGFLIPHSTVAQTMLTIKYVVCKKTQNNYKLHKDTDVPVFGFK